jgi:hypothetical protein
MDLSERGIHLRVSMACGLTLVMGFMSQPDAVQLLQRLPLHIMACWMLQKPNMDGETPRITSNYLHMHVP